MGIFSIFKSKKQRKLDEIARVSSVFKTLFELQKDGLILWEGEKRRLYIEQPLAILMMSKECKWRAFLHNCYLWVYYQECESTVESYMVEEELKAVRRAKKVCPNLSVRDINRIKAAKREEISFSDIEKIAPELKAFEFFIIRRNSEALPGKGADGGTGETVAGGELQCVGQYNPESKTFEIALWKDVEKFIHQNKQ